MRLIDGDELYKAMKDAEDLARQRVLDTESTLPYPNNLNPSYTRYLAQMDERTKAKHMIADAPTVDAVEVVRCRECQNWRSNITCGAVILSGKLWNYCHKHNEMMTEDDFCSRGERKDGDHND